jgi:hypothetical protein
LTCRFDGLPAVLARPLDHQVVETDLAEFVDDHRRSPMPGCFSTWLSTVVLPPPRNPVSSVVGINDAGSVELIPDHPLVRLAGCARSSLAAEAPVRAVVSYLSRLMSPCPTDAAGTAATTALASAARAAIGLDDKFDLVIKGGEVFDPSGPAECAAFSR